MTVTITDAATTRERPFQVGVADYDRLPDRALREELAFEALNAEILERDPDLSHHRTRVHRQAQPGCPWCTPTPCRCGEGCTDPLIVSGHSRIYGIAETTWRESVR